MTSPTDAGQHNLMSSPGGPLPAPARRAGRRPDDAVAFVESAQRATNEYNAEPIYDLFATNARSVMITGGAREESVGVQAIHDAWARACTVLKARRFTVEKRFVAATDDTIVAEFCGGPRGRREGCGIEVYCFDHESKVISHHLYSHLKVRPMLHPIPVLQQLLGSPATALAGVWAILRHR